MANGADKGCGWYYYYYYGTLIEAHISSSYPPLPSTHVSPSPLPTYIEFEAQDLWLS